jgi:hypothetical protein
MLFLLDIDGRCVRMQPHLYPPLLVAARQSDSRMNTSEQQSYSWIRPDLPYLFCGNAA